MDREACRRLLRDATSSSYELWEASSLREGIDLAEQHEPDCVLLDYCLGDGDGLEFLRAVSAETGLPRLPMILLTGMAGARPSFFTLGA